MSWREEEMASDNGHAPCFTTMGQMEIKVEEVWSDPSHLVLDDGIPESRMHLVCFLPAKRKRQADICLVKQTRADRQHKPSVHPAEKTRRKLRNRDRKDWSCHLMSCMHHLQGVVRNSETFYAKRPMFGWELNRLNCGLSLLSRRLTGRYNV